MDRDAALEIAEQSHKNQARVPGIGYFYGELSWSGAWDVVGLANPKEGDVFIDMGSGVGKMVLAAAMTRGFKECRGVEILPELHEKATMARAKLRDAVGDEAFAMLPPTTLELGDMLAADKRRGHRVLLRHVLLSRGNRGARRQVGGGDEIRGEADSSQQADRVGRVRAVGGTRRIRLRRAVALKVESGLLHLHSLTTLGETR